MAGNRRFVLVQIPEETTGQFSTLTEIGEERIRRAGAKIAAEIDESNKQLELGADPKPYPDLGFRVIRIDSSNFKDFYLTPGETSQESLFDFADNVKKGRSDLDLLFEVLPKLGIPYSAKIEERMLAGKKVFFVDGDKLAACFDANVGSDTIEEWRKPSLGTLSTRLVHGRRRHARQLRGAVPHLQPRHRSPSDLRRRP